MPHRGSLRAADADRDRVVDRLRAAAAEGRIASDELEERVHRALTARTYDELDATVADLPGPRRRGSARGSGSEAPARRSSVGHWALTAVRANPFLLFFVIPAVAVTGAILLAASIMWAAMMLVVLVVGGRSRHPQGPWSYAWGHHAHHTHGHHFHHGHHTHGHHGPPPRRPRNYWA